MAKQDDSFFLLEVLVDKITFAKSPCFSDKDFRTCISFDFMSAEQLEICDDDSTKCTKVGGPFVKYYNSGKSCLFVLKEGEIKQASSKFPIKATVYKSLPCGCLPTKIVIGECTIDMTKEFVQARQKFLEGPGGVGYQALKDTFRFIAPDGSQAADIALFLRISCMGKSVVTRFQGTAADAGGPLPTMDGISGAGKPRKDGQNALDPCRCGAERSCGITGQAFGPGDCCPTGNKIVFQLPTDLCGTGHKQRTHFHFTSDGIGDVSRDEPGALIPTTTVDYPGVVYDFPKQVIKLRIGKTVEMPGKKSNLEYQFITPVFSDTKEIPVRDTRTTQCIKEPPPCCRPCKRK